VETGKDCIKLFFQVFNIGEGSKAPYIEIFIKALNRERTDDELQYKMEIVFSESKNNIIIEKNKIDQNNGTNDNKNIIKIIIMMKIKVIYLMRKKMK